MKFRASIQRVDRSLFVHAFGQWMPRSELSSLSYTLSGRKGLAQRRRQWFARPRSEGGKTW